MSKSAPKRSESRRRPEMVGVRFTADERAALVGTAAELGCTVPELVRLSVALYTDPHVRTDPSRRFGGPAVRGISVDAIAGMVFVGEDVETIYDEYNLTRPHVLVACWWQATYGPKRYRLAWRDWLRANESAIVHGEYDKVEYPPMREEKD